MFRIAWRSLIAHKLRTLLTTLAILLGVAMISGTFVLTDQINRGFDEIFSEAYKGTDVTITRKAEFTSQFGGTSEALPESLADEIGGVDGVKAAYGYVSGMGAVAVDGEVVQTGGSPTLFFSTVPSDISNTDYVEGAPPASDGQIGVVRKLADDQGLSVGSPLQVITDTGAYDVSVSGVFTFAKASSLGGSLLLGTTLADGQRWFGLEGRLSEIDVQAEPGTSPETLAGRIREVVPAYAEVKTGQQAAADQTKEISESIGQFLTPVLLSFGGVAVLVGAFIIFNAFSMTVAQRRREFAMLRALGASRRQVLVSITGEALVMGVLASLVGLFAGLGVATGVNALFQAAGVDIPRSGLVMEPRTVIVALAVGIGVTLLSAIVPALRATRVPPVAALQEGASLPPSRFARFMPYVAVAAAVLGALGIVGGMYGSGGTTARLGQIAFGAIFIFLAVAVVSKYFIRPVAGVIGWPLQRLSAVSGRLARDNARRNPERTAATAAALMIGLGVVVFVAVFAQGLKTSFVDSYDRTVRADYVISGTNFLPLPAEAVRRAEAVPATEVVSPLNVQQVQAGSAKTATALYGIDPGTFQRLWQFEWIDGSDDLLGQLGVDGAVVEEQTAASLDVKRGDTLAVTTSDGKTGRLDVRGIYRDPMMINGITVSGQGYDALFTRPQYFMAFATMSGGATPENSEALKTALEGVPTAEVRDDAEYKDSIIGQVNQLLNLMYGLLAMSVIISLFGIVNTLVLAVYERTREIGLVRAIGASRSQVRATVRYESVITSVIGGILGILVGIAFAWVINQRFAGIGITFSIPWTQLFVFLFLAVIVGVIAAILPARRAAKIDILAAIHYE